MPGTQPAAMSAAGPWDWVKGMFNNITRRLTALEHSQTLIILDQYQCATAILGPLNQRVTNGAAHLYAGTEQSTGLTGAGLAVVQSYLTSGTVTATTDTVTVLDPTGFADGMSITAPGIPAGTTISNVAGATVTISTVADATATGAPITAYVWRNLASLTFP